MCFNHMTHTDAAGEAAPCLSKLTKAGCSSLSVAHSPSSTQTVHLDTRFLC